MIKLSIICFVIFVFGANAEGTCNVQGYYWRDLAGKIPDDALPAGFDINMQPIYIGQIFNLSFIIPAKVYSSDRKAYYEYGGAEYVESQNIKIFCTQHPEHFEWIQTNNDDIRLLTGEQLIIGGYEPGCTTYIGRVRTGGEVLVGKVIADNIPQNHGLHVTKDGKGMKFTSFAVLAYNPNAKC